MRHKRSGTKKQKSRKSIGIIAEDHSDVAVLRILISKITKAPFSLKPTVGGGCGKIVGKCHVWAQNLHDQGCRYLIVVHDLDTRIIAHLRAQLAAALNPSPIALHLIVIPVREIEAWLLSDHVAITKAMKLVEPVKMVPNPEVILRPKEYLADLVFRKSRKKRRYVNALDNAKIAALCIMSNLRRCASFVPLSAFISEHIK
jgi:hypothetical protein